MRALAIVGMLYACDGVRTHPVAPDSRQIDAPPEDALDPMAHHYIVSRETFPLSTTEALAMGLDLDGDDVVENQFGSVLSTFAAQGFSPQNASNLAVGRGDILLLAELTADSFSDGPATFTLFTGANPEPAPCQATQGVVCGAHLTGTGTFDIAPTSAHDPPLEGSLVAGEMVSGPGRLRLDASFGETPFTVNLVGARVQIVTPSENGIASGVIAGGIVQSEVDNQLIPGLAASLDAALQRDCPGLPPSCGCIDGTTGKSLEAVFDTNHDCNITATDLRTNNVIDDLLHLDVEVEGTMAMSFGIGFVAAKASFDR
jgi:hypothetical protein